MSFSFVGGTTINAADASSEALSRQLNVLVAHLDAPGSFAALQTAHIFRRLASLPTEAGSLALRKATLKCQSLISSKPAQGFRLALLLASQVGWSGEDGSIPKHARDWLNASLSYLAAVSTGANPTRMDKNALQSLLSLIQDHILSEKAIERPEFARSIVTGALPKLGTLLTACIEVALKANGTEALQVLLPSTVKQLERYPSSLRPFAPRLHAASVILAFSANNASLRVEATRLLGYLHLIGAQSAPPQKAKDLAVFFSGGKTTQSQLWSSTIQAVIGSAWDACLACLSTFEPSGSPALPKHRLDLPTLSHNDFTASWERLELILGQDGVLLELLRMPTKRPVPVPLSSLFRLVAFILPQHPARQAVEATLHALQSARLPLLRIMALRLLQVIVSCVKAAGQGALLRFGTVAVELLVQILEDVSTVPAVRAMAARTLALTVGTEGLVIPSDSNARVTLRANRVCIFEIAQLMLQSNDALDTCGASESSATESPATGARKKKRSRLYESDSISSASAPQVLALKPDLERASACSALDALPFLYGHLLTSSSPSHYELAHAAVNVVSILAEVSLRGAKLSEACDQTVTEELATLSLRCLARLLRATSAGPMLGLLAPKVSSLARYALAVVAPSSLHVAAAAFEAGESVRDVVVPRLPPVLAGKIDEDDEGGNEQWAVQQWRADPATGQQMSSSTGSAHLIMVDSSTTSLHAAGNILGIKSSDDFVKKSQASKNDLSKDCVGTSPPSVTAQLPRNQVFLGPRHSSPGSVQSSDGMEPMKPLRRPTTPKIGSPSALRVSTADGVAGASPKAKELFGRSPSQEGPEKSAEAIATANADDEDPFDSMPALTATTLEHVQIPASEKATAAPSIMIEASALVADSDEEEMPEIDIGSSDEYE